MFPRDLYLQKKCTCSAFNFKWPLAGTACSIHILVMCVFICTIQLFTKLKLYLYTLCSYAGWNWKDLVESRTERLGRIEGGAFRALLKPKPLNCCFFVHFRQRGDNLKSWTLENDVHLKDIIVWIFTAKTCSTADQEHAGGKGLTSPACAQTGLIRKG